jgi:predicted TPR repeat methyltransferase
MDHKISTANPASLHDAYAADYDEKTRVYDCYLADALFGLCFEYLQSGESILDLGIGSGLSALPFAKAGMRIHGMDFSPAMLEVCRAKGIATELKQHDLLEVPWPSPASQFDHIICCGVLHFISDLEVIFSEAKRVAQDNAIFAFTTKAPLNDNAEQHGYDQQTVGDFSIFAHHSKYVQGLLEHLQFKQLKQLKCFIGADIFHLYVARKMQR